MGDLKRNVNWKVLITIGSYENYGRWEFSDCHIGLVMNEVKLVDKWVIITRKLDRERILDTMLREIVRLQKVNLPKLPTRQRLNF